MRFPKRTPATVTQPTVPTAAPSDATQPTVTAALDAPTPAVNDSTPNAPRAPSGISADAMANLCDTQPVSAANGRLLSSMFAAHPGI
jgi:hypothetical protein